ncbi:MAG: AI-2E family transporter [Terriglobales bacterium]
MTSEKLGPGKLYLSRALEVSIHLGLILVLAVACLVILRPFVALITWAIIIAVAGHPTYYKLQRILGGRSRLAAVLFTVFLVAVLIVPIILLAQTLIEGYQTLAEHLHGGTLAIPPPPPNIESWPLIGRPLNGIWSLASTNLGAALKSLAPQVKALASGLLSASAGVGIGVVEFFFSIVIAGILLSNARGCAAVSRSLANGFFGGKGAEFEELATATIRSVTTGILGVALIQSLFASVGFLVVGLPGAGLWTLVFLIGATLQVGGVVLIPAVVYAFATFSTTKAVVFLIWCIVVGLMDNVLKPLLLGRGVAVPIVVIFLGAIGGFIAMGLIGLFVGAVVLSVGYKLFQAWLDDVEATSEKL